MRRKLRVNILCLLGVLLTIAGVAGVLDGPNVSQYAALPGGYLAAGLRA